MCIRGITRVTVRKIPEARVAQDAHFEERMFDPMKCHYEALTAELDESLPLIFDDLRRADRLRDAACIMGLLLVATLAFLL